MAGIITTLKKYIYDIIGINIKDPTRLKMTSLPFFILDRYTLYRTSLIHKRCVLMVFRSEEEISPVELKKHIEFVREKVVEDVVFVHPSISSHNRKRLIEFKIPFIIPGNQMYLPDLMIDLREYFYTTRSSKQTFSPSTQAVIIYILSHFREQPFTPSVLATKLDYANMTMTRAFDEIEAAKIGRHDIEGRQRWLWIQSEKRQFWKNVLPYLKTPIRRHVWLRVLPEELRKYESGETALSHYTMLAPPKYKTFATKKNDWEFYRRRDDIEVLNSKEEANFQLQIWNYNPKIFAQGKTVDKFSLYLSLKENKDERIQKALEEMMETIEW